MKKFFYAILVLLSISYSTRALAQADTSKPKVPAFTKPQWADPSYKDMSDYITKNIKYPAEAEDKGIEGTIMIQAMVDTMGKMQDIREENTLGHGLDSEAVRVVRAMPALKPATNNGRPARTRMKFPVIFKLDKELTEDSIKKIDKVFDGIPDQGAQFQGGNDAVQKYMDEHMQLPADVKYEGMIYVAFDVEKDGSLTNVHMTQATIKALDDEAVRVVKAMPKWSPALKLGKPVKTSVTVPVKIDRK